MASRMDEFRLFVAKYPKIRDDVVNGKKTWQNIYEDWVILGEQNDIWNIYKDQKKDSSDFISSDSIKNIMNYIKKINPDSISKTLNTIQKVLQISQSFNGRPGIYNANYNSWWD